MPFQAVYGLKYLYFSISYRIQRDFCGVHINSYSENLLLSPIGFILFIGLKQPSDWNQKWALLKKTDLECTRHWHARSSNWID